MTGDKFNNKQGQVLLIIVMLLATAVTIVLAVTFRSTTDTQLAKLEEDNQRALAAAQAGIEEALRQGADLNSFSSLNIPSGFSGNAKFSSAPQQSFITPLLHKNEQYTFYATQYTNNQLTSNYFNGYVNFFIGSETSCPALEITAISSTNTIIKYLVDPCSSFTSNTNTISTWPAGQYTPAGETIKFTYKTSSTFPMTGDTKVVFLRILNANTRIGIEATSGTLPVQGKTVVSTVNAPSGVSKKIVLFQSYPQIPADFFVTSY